MNLSYEQINGEIAQLPLIEQRRLLEDFKRRLESHLTTLDAQDHNSTNGAEDFAWPDPAPNDDWLKEHAQEFQGQWVVVENGRLLASGNDGQAMAAAVRNSGARIPLMLFIPPETPPEIVPFIGWL